MSTFSSEYVSEIGLQEDCHSVEEDRHFQDWWGGEWQRVD